MKSKYLIGLLPSIFILTIACLAKASPLTEAITDHNSFFAPEPTMLLLLGSV